MKKLLLTFLILLFSLTNNIVIAERGGTSTSSLTTEQLENEKKINNVIVEEARIRSQTNPGFRDLKPGIAKTDYLEKCLLKSDGDICYGIQNIKFTNKYGERRRESSIGSNMYGVQILSHLILNMGPIVASDGSFFSQLNNLVVNNDDEPNIYLKMKKNFDAKYVLDYEYSERDRQLFNEGEKDDLLGVYSNGQVALRINLKERDYSKDLWLYIEYRDVDAAKEFLEKNRPVIATLDDF
jgi:hypothetical protein